MTTAQSQTTVFALGVLKPGSPAHLWLGADVGGKYWTQAHDCALHGPPDQIHLRGMLADAAERLGWTPGKRIPGALGDVGYLDAHTGAFHVLFNAYKGHTGDRAHIESLADFERQLQWAAAHPVLALVRRWLRMQPLAAAVPVEPPRFDVRPQSTSSHLRAMQFAPSSLPRLWLDANAQKIAAACNYQFAAVDVLLVTQTLECFPVPEVPLLRARMPASGKLVLHVFPENIPREMRDNMAENPGQQLVTVSVKAVSGL